MIRIWPEFDFVLPRRKDRWHSEIFDGMRSGYGAGGEVVRGNRPFTMPCECGSKAGGEEPECRPVSGQGIDLSFRLSGL
jgi:hypothetical protein